jgi:hypothetical protein
MTLVLIVNERSFIERKHFCKLLFVNKTKHNHLHITFNNMKDKKPLNQLLSSPYCIEHKQLLYANSTTRIQTFDLRSVKRLIYDM